VGYFVWLTVHGALAGAIYALIALAFVIVYKSSRAINFAVGEWIMYGALLTAAALHRLHLKEAGLPGLVVAVVLACLGMTILARLFAWMVLRRMGGRSLMALIMLTLGLGMFMRGTGAMIFKGTPNAISLPVGEEYVELFDLTLQPERLLSACIAGLCIVLVGSFYRFTRTGLALRAIASNPHTALGMGINTQGLIALSWIIAALIGVAGGVLWSVVSGGGIGTALVGLKVFPIVVIGGLNSIPGCIVGAMVIGIAEGLASGYLDPILGSGVSIVVSSSLLLATLWLRPQGLFGERLVVRV